MPPKKDNKDKGGGKDKGKAAGGAKGGKADKEKEKTGTNTAIKVRFNNFIPVGKPDPA